jgi:hypothetical protein
VVPANTRVTQSEASTTTTSQVTLPVSQLPVATLTGFSLSNGTIHIGPAIVPGCFEADTTRIQDFVIWGSGVRNDDEGIHINSANCFQGSLIEKGSFQGEYFGVHIVNSNGNLRLLSLNGGHESNPANPDSEAVFLQFDPPVVSSPDLWDIETEGDFELSVHDAACNSFAGSPGSPTWIGNQFNIKVLADGCETITSIGNEAGIGTMVAAGTTKVVSLNEARWIANSGQAIVSTWNNGVLSTDFVGARNSMSDGCAGKAQLSSGKPTPGDPAPPPPGTTIITDVCLDGASVIGVAEMTSSTPNALGWSLTGPTLTIRSANSADTSFVTWWRLK